MFRAYEGIEGRKIKIKKLKVENVIQNKIQDFKRTLKKIKKGDSTTRLVRRGKCVTGTHFSVCA
jgi:hypothetical protein